MTSSNIVLHIWWGVSSVEYLAPTKRKFLIIFSIDVAGMRQRWRTFDSKWYEMGVMAKMGVDYVMSYSPISLTHISKGKNDLGRLASLSPAQPSPTEDYPHAYSQPPLPTFIHKLIKLSFSFSSFFFQSTKYWKTEINSYKTVFGKDIGFSASLPPPRLMSYKLGDL